MDLTQSDARVMLGADQAIASLAPLSLHAKDEVSIYLLDCELIHPTDQGATDAATLKRQVHLVLRQSQSVHWWDTKPTCQNPINLWDSLVTIVQTLSKRPGRRVILAVTDGVDQGSRDSWNALRDFTQARSVAIFGLVQPWGLRHPQNETPFDDLCQARGLHSAYGSSRSD